MRTGGAVLLASLGLDTTRIEAMAGWNSPMLLYYIRSSPLKSITREVGTLLQAKGDRGRCGGGSRSDAHGTLLKAISDLGNRLDSALEALSEREQRIESLEARVAPSQFICNITSGMWHHTRDHRAGLVCYTSCGWTHTGAHFEVSHALPSPVSHKLMCGTCLPKMCLEAKTKAAMYCRN